MTERELYRPSNGTEGCSFFNAWCATCARDAVMNGTKSFDDCEDRELCDLVARSLRCDINDPNYPCEWVRTEEGPTCTAWLPMDNGKPERCPNTIDMFTGEPG